MAECFAGGHLRYLDGEWRDDNGDVVKIKEARYGMWRVVRSLDDGAAKELECSDCKARAIFGKVPIKFCPNCGADMRGVTKL